MMVTYKIIRVYEVPAENRIEATNRMMEALVLGVEKHWHVTDVIRGPKDVAGKGEEVNLGPSKGWLESFIDQIRGL